MGSFKLKLVLWFALLALLPLAVAFYGYDTLAKRSETRRVDAVLEAAVRGAVAGYAARLDAASTRAAQLAADPRLQTALRGHDWNTLRRLVAVLPATEVRARGFHTGTAPSPAAASTVTVKDRDGSVLGTVTVRVPIDAGLLNGLATGLALGDRLVAVRGGHIIAGIDTGEPL